MRIDRKHLRVVERRNLGGNVKRALRKILKEVDDGYAVGVCIAATRRDGSIYTFSSSEDPVKQLGAIAILSEDIKDEMVKR